MGIISAIKEKLSPEQQFEIKDMTAEQAVQDAKDLLVQGMKDGGFCFRADDEKGMVKMTDWNKETQQHTMQLTEAPNFEMPKNDRDGTPITEGEPFVDAMIKELYNTIAHSLVDKDFKSIDYDKDYGINILNVEGVPQERSRTENLYLYIVGGQIGMQEILEASAKAFPQEAIEKQGNTEFRAMTEQQKTNDAYNLMVELMQAANFFFKENEEGGLNRYSGVVPEYAAITGDSTECSLDGSFQLPHTDRDNAPITNGEPFAKKVFDTFFIASKATEKDPDEAYMIENAGGGMQITRTENLYQQLAHGSLMFDDVVEASKESHPEEFQKTDRDIAD